MSSLFGLPGQQNCEPIEGLLYSLQILHVFLSDVLPRRQDILSFLVLHLYAKRSVLRKLYNMVKFLYDQRRQCCRHPFRLTTKPS